MMITISTPLTCPAESRKS